MQFVCCCRSANLIFRPLTRGRLTQRNTSDPLNSLCHVVSPSCRTFEVNSLRDTKEIGDEIGAVGATGKSSTLKWNTLALTGLLRRGSPCACIISSSRSSRGTPLSRRVTASIASRGELALEMTPAAHVPTQS